MFGLLGCHSEPQFPNPIEPTENKSETIQKWLDDFSYWKEDDFIDKSKSGIVDSYYNWKDKPYDVYAGESMWFDYYGPIIPYSLQSGAVLCLPKNNNYPKTVINYYEKNKKSIFVFKNGHGGYKYLYLSNDIKKQCDKSYETIKNQYSSFMKDGIIDDTEYKQLNNVYLKEHSNVINTIRLLDKQSKEDDWKEKNLDEYNDKNGINVKLHITNEQKNEE